MGLLHTGNMNDATGVGQQNFCVWRTWWDCATNPYCLFPAKKYAGHTRVLGQPYRLWTAVSSQEGAQAFGMGACCPQTRCSAVVAGTARARSQQGRAWRRHPYNDYTSDLGEAAAHTLCQQETLFGLCCRLRLCAVCQVEPSGSRHGSAQQQDAARHLRGPSGGQIRRRQAERPHAPPCEASLHIDRSLSTAVLSPCGKCSLQAPYCACEEECPEEWSLVLTGCELLGAEVRAHSVVLICRCKCMAAGWADHWGLGI